MSSALRPTARALSVSVVRTTLCSGAKNADGPISSRACAVCSGVVRYGCAPALRRADSFRTWGPRAATTRRCAGTVVVESVQVLHQRVVGLAVLADRLGM